MTSSSVSNEKRPEKRAPSMTVKTVGAMIGGALEACCLQPLDVLKTRLQLGGAKATLTNTTVAMFKQEGPRAFYKGLTPFVVHLVTKYSVRWHFNEFYRGLFADKNGKVSMMGGLAAGMGSGITEAVLIVTPFEVVKIRLQKQKGVDKSKLQYTSPVDCVQKIVRQEGVTALWKGNIPTMTRQGINQLFLFGAYDYLKLAVFGLQRDAVAQPQQALALGIIAGALGPLFNNPIDVAKTRLMAEESIAGVAPKYTGMIQCIMVVGREEGLQSLMRGCMMRIARVAPGMGLTFVVVEKFSELFG